MKQPTEVPPPRPRPDTTLLAFLALLLLATATRAAATQLVLARNSEHELAGEYSGIVDLAVDPGLDNAKVTVTVDGQKVADSLLSPYHVAVDFGPIAIQHRIGVVVRGAGGKRAQWQQTINRGNLPLTLKVQPVDLAARVFEAAVTAPKDDPIVSVQLWDNGRVAQTATSEPYRFTIPEGMLAAGLVQVTAKTKSGEEAADFWSPAGNVHAEELQVRTVPIFVSVVDRNGQTRDDVDASHFRILDNESEAKIIEFGKAFDQPISIALLLDASASMTYSMDHAEKAAAEFVARSLKAGDRCSVTAVQDVPRRKQALTDDRAQVAKALEGIRPLGRTALYDGVMSAIRELHDEKNRRAIVILTDGSDNSSNYTYDDIQQTAREAGIPIYFIAYESGGESDARDLDRLRYLAGETGGFVAIATEQNLMAKYNEIEKDLRAQFAITYQVSDLSKSNEWRRVRVVLDSPKLTARTIKGYFAP
ncbi:MAG: VWA domain-containing protein [Acidobacteria bacterium]|nr:VWA domain-containing protein [Acidobacteriota bacterium]MBV9477064.1 VWA domain-containing protein [Acidobacteriota bacterium]